MTRPDSAIDDRSCVFPSLGATLRSVLFVALVGALFADGIAAAERELPPTLGHDAIDRAVARLADEHPTVRVIRDGEGRIVLAGVPMATADDRDAAVDAWFERYGDAVGALAHDRELVSVTALEGTAATVYAYRLHRGTVEIEGGISRVLVREWAGAFHVTHVAAIAALPFTDRSPTIIIEAERAAALALHALAAHPFEDRDPPSAASAHWGTPRLVLRPGTLDLDGREPVLAWHVEVHEDHGRDPGAWTVRIDPTTGALIEIRDERLHVDVVGSVTTEVTPAPLPDIGSNPPVAVAQPRINVSIAGGASALTDVNGDFVIPHPGSAPVDLVVDLVGPWVTVLNFSGAEYQLTQSVTPPFGGVLALDAGGTETIQSQLNAFFYTDRTHEWYRDYTANGAPGIDISLPVRANVADVCNATYDPIAVRMNLFLSGGGCANTAFSNVIHHEYGHFIVDMLNVPQGAFGEGFGDVVAMLIDDDPIIGRDFGGPGTAVRDPLAANVQYPCSVNQTVHFCGMILGAVWWRIRTNFATNRPDAVALEDARQRFTDWSLVTIGGENNSSAHPTTAVELLSVDDDDPFLANGTPNATEICDAFAAHSIPCPAFPPVEFAYPLGRPATVTPGVATDFVVQIVPGTASLDFSSARLQVRDVGSAAIGEFPLIAQGGTSFLATIPGQICGGAVGFAVAIDDLTGTTHFSPEGGAEFSALVFDTIVAEVDDPFSSPAGWTLGEPTDTATSGFWEWGNPIGTAAAPGDDHSSNDVNCFFTQNGFPGGSLGAADIDGGITTLTSPAYDLSAPGEYGLSYWRWFSNDTGAGPNQDVFEVQISNDGGANWSPLETVGPTGPEASAGWFRASFDVASVIAPTDAVRLRFIVGDTGDPSLVEAAIDDLRIERRDCDPPLSFRRGDLTGEGDYSITDAIALLGYLFQGQALECLDLADVNDNGTANLADVIALLTYLFSGGAGPAAPFPDCGVDPSDDALDCPTVDCI